MRLSSLLLSTLFVVGGTLIESSRASAAGFEFPDSGSAATTRGGASASGIHDPTAGFLNPALLSRLSGLRISYNHNLVFSHTSFSRSPSSIPDPYDYESDVNSRVGDGTAPSENQESFFPINGLLALSYQLKPHFTIGLSAHGPNGSGAARYPIQGGQRYMITQLDALLAFVGASAAYGGDHWGVGATLQLATLPNLKYRMVVDGTSEAALNPNLSVSDIEAEVSVSDPAAFTALIGAWFRPTPAFEIALSGRVLPVRFDATGDVTVHNTPNDIVFGESMLEVQDSSAALRLTLPQTAKLGFRYRGLDPDQKRERFDIELTFVYERWSVMDELKVELEGKVLVLGNSPLQDVTLDKKWRDTLSARLGGGYQLTDKLKLSAGGFYEQGAVPPQYAHLDFPSYDRFGLAGGLAYQVVPELELVVGYLHIFESEVNVDELEGKVFQQRPIAPCAPDAGCGENAAGEAYSGVPANAGRHRASFQNITLGLNARF